MYLLYIDESGSPDDQAHPFVVGGLALQAQRVAAIRRDVEAIFAKHLDPHDPHHRGLELHATELLGGKNRWRRIPRDVRMAIRDDVLRLLGAQTAYHRLFAVVRSPGAIKHADPLERVFEELLLRFSSFLARQRIPASRHGIVIADKAKYESTLQPMASKWRDDGTRFHRLTNIAEVPLFVDSAETRLIQLADFVAHSVFRHYRDGDDFMLKPLLDVFDETAGKRHGLVHLTVDHRSCACHACSTR